MPKKLVRPPDENKICGLPGGWSIYRHPPSAADSPLWVCVKIIAPPTQRRRMGQLRAFWLYWGVDARRFRRARHLFRLEQEQPAVAAAATCALRLLLSPRSVEAQLGPTRMALERERLSVSTAKRQQFDRARLEAAHEEALAEDEARRRRLLWRPSNPS